MKVIFPNNNNEERKYAAKILLESILEVNFETTFAEQSNTVIELENGLQIIFEDHFFNHYPTANSYLNLSAVPCKSSHIKNDHNPFITEKDLPILFGTDAFRIDDFGIYCGIDVFATAFFCLTRWEEAVNPIRDLHGRFPAAASIAWKYGYLHRPIVNEMAAMLRNLFLHLGEKLPSSTRKFELLITHDVDQHYLWPNLFSFFKKTAGDLIKRQDLTAALFNFRSYFSHKFSNKPDPYDSYDYLMNLSERFGLTSHFFFLAGGTTKFDNAMKRLLPNAKPIMDRINTRGHKIGIHPSYLTATNETLFEQEVEQFRNISPQDVCHGRQHFLRFEVGKTWLLWEKNGLTLDSTLGYPEHSGFRCGTCTPFPVFDIFERRQLNLIESPLTAMDTTYAVYQKAAATAMETDLLKLLATVKKYNGTFTLLWHNTSFQVPEYQMFTPIYERFLAEATSAS